MSSIPVFVLGILLFELAGVIDLPPQFVPFSSVNSPLDSYESLILPTVVVTLMGLPSVVFMSRNEFIEIFKSEYIKTAKGKGFRDNSWPREGGVFCTTLAGFTAYLRL